MSKARRRTRRGTPGATPPADHAGLRADLVAELLAEGVITTPAVEQAFRRVPRHLFTPGIGAAAAYSNAVVLLKRDRDGTPISSVSAPDMQAIMLEQLDVRPGMKVLEIGSGGYNAALLAELVRGPTGGTVADEAATETTTCGEVTTVDIDPEVAGRARRCLDNAGYPHVRVILADASDGVPGHAPYDRIVVTAEAWDLPTAWLRQLTPTGRIVVPLRLRTLTRSVALDRVGDRLVSRSSHLCGFVKMQGSARHSDASLFLLDGEIRFNLDALPDDAEAADLVAALESALQTPRAEAWSGVTVGRQEAWDSLPLWLATVHPDFAAVAVNIELTSGLVQPALRVENPAVLNAGRDGFAYLAVRTASDASENSVEFGAHAFGADAGPLAAEFAAQIAVWDRDFRHGPGPTIVAWPPDSPAPRADRVIAKRYVNIALDWPSRTPGD